MPYYRRQPTPQSDSILQTSTIPDHSTAGSLSVDPAPRSPVRGKKNELIKGTDHNSGYDGPTDSSRSQRWCNVNPFPIYVIFEAVKQKGLQIPSPGLRALELFQNCKSLGRAWYLQESGLILAVLGTAEASNGTTSPSRTGARRSNAMGQAQTHSQPQSYQALLVIDFRAVPEDLNFGNSGQTSILLDMVATTGLGGPKWSLTRLSQAGQQAFTISSEFLLRLRCVLSHHAFQRGKDHAKSKCTSGNPWDAMTIEIDFLENPGPAKPMPKSGRLPRASIATMVFPKDAESTLFGCQVYKVNPALCPECENKCFRTEESIRHRNTGHLDKAHGNLWYVSSRKPIQIRGKRPEQIWKDTLIGIYSVYKDYAASLNPHYGQRLIEDERTEVRLRQLQMDEFRMSESSSEPHRHDSDGRPEYEQRRVVPRYRLTDIMADRAVDFAAASASGSLPTNSGAAVLLPSTSGETSFLQQSSSLPDPSGTSVTSFGQRIPPLRFTQKTSEHDSLSSQSLVDEQHGESPSAMASESNYPTPPPAMSPHSTNSDARPAELTAGNYQQGNASNPFPLLSHPFDVEPYGSAHIDLGPVAPPGYDISDFVNDELWTELTSSNAHLDHNSNGGNDDGGNE